MDNVVLFLTMLNHFLKLLPSQKVYAHCDIPCGLYDPGDAQLAAKTVLVMVQKINALPKENPTVNDRNSFVRMVMNKEDQAEICERELVTLWVDYFKEEHLEKFPDLHDTFWKATKLCAKNMQNVDEVMAQELVQIVDKIAQMFAETKKG